jgi:hypothetical protein
MSYEKFYSIIKKKLKYIVDHLKILKIIQTEGNFIFLLLTDLTGFYCKLHYTKNYEIF